jgi:hypothetical protein
MRPFLSLLTVEMLIFGLMIHPAQAATFWNTKTMK